MMLAMRPQRDSAIAKIAFEAATTTSHAAMIPVPPAIRRIPWKLIALLSAITGFGLLVLYSAAGGNLWPWAGQQGVRFLIVSVAALGANLVVLHLLVTAGAGELLAQAIAIVIVTPVNFVGNKLWSFRRG